jgi:hypothetical protein
MSLNNFPLPAAAVPAGSPFIYNSSNVAGVTPSVAAGTFTIVTPGNYLVLFNAYGSSDNAVVTKNVAFEFQINGLTQFLVQEATTTSLFLSLSIHRIFSLSAGDVVRVLYSAGTPAPGSFIYTPNETLSPQLDVASFSVIKLD